MYAVFVSVISRKEEEVNERERDRERQGGTDRQTERRGGRGGTDRQTERGGGGAGQRERERERESRSSRRDRIGRKLNSLVDCCRCGPNHHP